MCSAIAATGIPSIVMSKGHRIEQTPEVPLVVDGEQDDEVGQHLHSSHQTSSLEQILFSRVETQPIEAHGNHNPLERHDDQSATQLLVSEQTKDTSVGGVSCHCLSLFYRNMICQRKTVGLGGHVDALQSLLSLANRYTPSWCLWSNWIDEEEEDIRGYHDELEGEPVVVDVANEDGVEETNSKRNLGKSCHEGSLLWEGPLKEDGE